VADNYTCNIFNFSHTHIKQLDSGLHDKIEVSSHVLTRAMLTKSYYENKFGIYIVTNISILSIELSCKYCPVGITQIFNVKTQN